MSKKMHTTLPPRPVLPFSAREYAKMSAETSRIFFKRGFPLYDEGWGTLHCTDAHGRHWTVFGNPKFVKAMRAAAHHPGDDALTASQPPEWNGFAVQPVLLDEFPLEAFEARYALLGWPDEWRKLGKYVLIRFIDFTPPIKWAEEGDADGR